MEQDFSDGDIIHPELDEVFNSLQTFKKNLEDDLSKADGDEKIIDEYGNLLSFDILFKEASKPRSCCQTSTLRIHGLIDPHFTTSPEVDLLKLSCSLKSGYENYAQFESDAIASIEKQLNHILPMSMALIRCRVPEKFNQSSFRQVYENAEALIRKEPSSLTTDELQLLITHIHPFGDAKPQFKEESLSKELRLLKYKSGLKSEFRVELFRQFILHLRSKLDHTPLKSKQSCLLFDLSIFYRMPLGSVLIDGLSRLLTKVGCLWPNSLINTLEWIHTLLDSALNNAQKANSLESLILKIKTEIQILRACIVNCYIPMSIPIVMLQ
jgi:hypothetical protein